MPDQHESGPRRWFEVRRAAVALALVGVIGWQLMESAQSEWVRLRSQPEFLTPRALVEADLEQRSRWTLGADHALHMTLRERVPEGAIIVLYTAVGPAVDLVRARMIQLHSRLLSLLYPADLNICFGIPVDAAAYRARLDARFYLVNVTPGAPIPLPEVFERVLDGDGFSLWRFRREP